MRVLGLLKEYSQALYFSNLLLQKQIENKVDKLFDATTQAEIYQILIVNEEDLQEAMNLFEDYQKQPHTFKEFKEIKEEKPLAERAHSMPKSTGKLTFFFILVCTLLFIFDVKEKRDFEQNDVATESLEIITPLEAALFFDDPFPKEIVEYRTSQKPSFQEDRTQKNDLPSYWQGFYPYFTGKKYNSLNKSVLFEKLRQGQIWRLFTPCLLHGNFLHLLFNMMWLYAIGPQIEFRTGIMRFLLLILSIGILSNIAQYLMSGPFFCGFSGVIVGLVGFIWVRQRKAPWEGYPLQKPVILFLLFFILAMLCLQLMSYFLSAFFHSENFADYVANTAHIVGGLVGISLGNLSYFNRRKKASS